MTPPPSTTAPDTTAPDTTAPDTTARPGRRPRPTALGVVTSWLASNPFLGIFFVLVVPVLGGFVYGPLIQRFAREARTRGPGGHAGGVRERRPDPIAGDDRQGAGVGDRRRRRRLGGARGADRPDRRSAGLHPRAARADVREPLRIIVACGAAAGIAATFNAPITGLCFGFEIVLREFSLEALSATALSAVTGVVISRAFSGSAPLFAQVPHNLSVTNDATYLLIVVLAIVAGLIGIGFKAFLYWLEDYVDRIWRAARSGLARPSAGSRSACSCSPCRRCTAWAIP